MVELVPGYGICCTQRQRDEVVSSSTTPGRPIRRLLPVFFSPETLAMHSCSGRGKNPPLDEDVIAACIGKLTEFITINISCIIPFQHLSKVFTRGQPEVCLWTT